MDGGSVGGTYGGALGDKRDGDGDGLIRCEDNASYITLGAEPNAPLAYDLGLEIHHHIMSTPVQHGGRLERKREREIDIFLEDIKKLYKYAGNCDYQQQ